MKNLIYILLFSFLFLSCKMKSEKESSSQPLTKELTKLEKLFLLPYDSVMVYYDLSNDNIENFPNLSAFTIKSLDLSHNLLDTINPLFLPKGLEKLNLSHNLYCGFILIRKNTIPSLKELDMSHNDLQAVYIHEALYRILLSYNDLTIACFNHENLRYLDISYNLHMPSEVCFEPTQIDTVIREGVAEGERLVGPISVRYYKPIK